MGRKQSPLEKELAALAKQERKAADRAARAEPAGWKTALEQKVPEKVYGGLQAAFSKGFSIVFSQGRGLIEKTYRKQNLLQDFAVRDFAIRLKGGRRELRQMRRAARRADLLNLIVTTVEGVILGLLGIGMPDIVIFLATVLQGVYKTSLHYGFDYTSGWEQLLILKMMAASLSTGENRASLDAEVDEMMEKEPCAVTEEEMNFQIQETAGVFALDMLLLKFIQGAPVVGIIGGASNPVYYRKILRYVQMKYRKRYLMRVRDGGQQPEYPVHVSTELKKGESL